MFGRNIWSSHYVVAVCCSRWLIRACAPSLMSLLLRAGSDASASAYPGPSGSLHLLRIILAGLLLVPYSCSWMSLHHVSACAVLWLVVSLLPIWDLSHGQMAFPALNSEASLGGASNPPDQ